MHGIQDAVMPISTALTIGAEVDRVASGIVYRQVGAFTGIPDVVRAFYLELCVRRKTHRDHILTGVSVSTELIVTANRPIVHGANQIVTYGRRLNGAAHTRLDTLKLGIGLTVVHRLAGFGRVDRLYGFSGLREGKRQRAFHALVSGEGDDDGIETDTCLGPEHELAGITRLDGDQVGQVHGHPGYAAGLITGIAKEAGQTDIVCFRRERIRQGYGLRRCFRIGILFGLLGSGNQNQGYTNRAFRIY